jgi:hypothetical protein
MKKPSQAERLRILLSDGKPHSTPEILDRVYGVGHSGIARIGARIADLKEKGCVIGGWRDEDNPTVYWYQMKARPKPRVEYVEIGGVMHARVIQPEI